MSASGHAAGTASTGRSLLDDCVHCGFCLAACPTYQSWGEEMDSPRGRIDLMRGVRDGRLELDAEVALHLDRCLGCMGCVTACPSGVKYDVLIEETRARIEERFDRGGFDALHRAALSEAAFAVYPTLGISFLSGVPSDDVAAAAAIASVRGFLAPAGGSLVLEEAPDGVRAHTDPWGPAPAAFALMRELKDRLDPEGRLNPGRFVGGL